MVADIPPRMAGAVLDNDIVLLQLDGLAVVGFEHDFTVDTTS
jgi:hypothetical protein